MSSKDPFHFAKKQLESDKTQDGDNKPSFLARVLGGKSERHAKNEIQVPHELANQLVEMSDEHVRIKATDGDYFGWTDTLSSDAEAASNFRDHLSNTGHVEEPIFRELLDPYTYQIEISVYNPERESSPEKYRVFGHWHNSNGSKTPAEFVNEELRNHNLAGDGWEQMPESKFVKSQEY